MRVIKSKSKKFSFSSFECVKAKALEVWESFYDLYSLGSEKEREMLGLDSTLKEVIRRP